MVDTDGDDLDDLAETTGRTTVARTTTKKATVLVDEPSTLVALGTDGTPIERVAVAVEGTSLP